MRDKIFIIFIGIIVGTLYYLNMKQSIDKQSLNCSFVSNILTDISAFIIGIILIHHGWGEKSNIVLAIGVAIIVEHILQFSYKI